MLENVITTRVDNRPPMLEKSQYKSWQSHMLLYIRGNEHGKDLLDSLLNGPLQYGTIEVHDTPTTPAFIRQRTMDDLADKEKIRKESVFPQHDSVLAVQSFLPTDDPIASLNKAMSFIRTALFKMSGSQYRICKDDKIKELRVVLDEEQLAFLADPVDRVDSGLDIQIMPTATIFQTDDLDAFDSDCDEAPSASEVFIANLSAYESYVLSKDEGTATFKKDNKKIIYKMPQKMEAFNHIDFEDVNTDSIPPFVLENNNDHGKNYYSDSLTLGSEYREDESISKEIRHLMKLERKAKRNKGGVT
uniref:Uncharacterized protein n=1 Tax=Tanacetum cinerariifolium TaxID=118510 RepID=A0A699GLB1_TANCI|nr:hypothetical protein [Tanacetum cinerariifolium]